MLSPALIDDHLGPRAQPPFMVRFGIWMVLTILGAVAAIGSLISYKDHAQASVQFAASLPVRSEAGPGRIRFQIRDGNAIVTNEIIARVEPPDRGMVVALAHIPSPLSSTIHPGDSLSCDIDDGQGIVRRRFARVDAVTTAASDETTVRLLLPGPPVKGTLHVTGENKSVLRRLITSLLRHE
jgi:hypothetical protein